MRKLLVSVIGGHKCAPEIEKEAEKAGRYIAAEGAVLVTGGLDGVMKAASRGASSEGGMTVGIVPGERKDEANEYVDIVVTTGMGFSRNTLVAGTADIVIAFPGSYGTLSEIAFALNAGKKVYGRGTWDIDGVVPLARPEEIPRMIREEKRRLGKS